MRLVLDTNVWLDWLVFADPAVAPIRAAVEAGMAEVWIDTACEAELALAAACGAHVLVTKDAALLELSRRLPFRILTPDRYSQV